MPRTPLFRGKSARPKRSRTPTKPLNLAGRVDTEVDGKLQSPKKRKTDESTEYLPENWDGNNESEEDASAGLDVEVNFGDTSLRQLTGMVLGYFVEDEKNKMLTQMVAVVHLMSRVSKKSVQEVIWAERYDEIYEQWDGSMPYDGHPKIGATFPRLEDWISNGMREYFRKECVAFLKEKKKFGQTHDDDKAWKKAWRKMCRFFVHFRKLHLYLLLASQEGRAKGDIQRAVRLAFKGLNTEKQVTNKIKQVVKRVHQTNFPEFWNPKKNEDEETESEEEEEEDEEAGDPLTPSDPTKPASKEPTAELPPKEPTPSSETVEPSKEETQAQNSEASQVPPTETMTTTTQTPTTPSGPGKLAGNAPPMAPTKAPALPPLRSYWGNQPDPKPETRIEVWPGRDGYPRRDWTGGPSILEVDGEALPPKYSEPSNDWKSLKVTTLFRLGLLVDLWSMQGPFENHCHFHFNRKLFIQTIINEAVTMDENGGIPPLGDPTKLTMPGAMCGDVVGIQPVAFAMAVLCIVMKGSLIQPNMTFHLDTIRRIHAVDLLRPGVMHLPENREKLRNALLASKVEAESLDKTMALLPALSAAIGEVHNDILPSNADVLAQLPGMTPEWAKVIVQDCMGVLQGLHLNVQNIKVLLAGAFVNYEESFFQDKTQGQDMLDLDITNIPVHNLEASLKSWVPIHMYRIFDQLTTLGHMADQPHYGLYDTRRLERRQCLLRFCKTNDVSNVAWTLSNTMDLCDRSRGAAWCRFLPAEMVGPPKHCKNQEDAIKESKDAIRRHIDMKVPSLEALAFLKQASNEYRKGNDKPMQEVIGTLTWEQCNFPFKGGETFLMVLASIDHLPALERALEIGADLNLLSEKNRNALHYAARANSVRAAKLIVECDRRLARQVCDEGYKPIDLIDQQARDAGTHREIMSVLTKAEAFIVKVWGDDNLDNTSKSSFPLSIKVVPNTKLAAIVDSFRKYFPDEVGRIYFVHGNKRLDNLDATVEELGLHDDPVMFAVCPGTVPLLAPPSLYLSEEGRKEAAENGIEELPLLRGFIEKANLGRMENVFVEWLEPLPNAVKSSMLRKHFEMDESTSKELNLAIDNGKQSVVSDSEE